MTQKQAMQKMENRMESADEKQQINMRFDFQRRFGDQESISEQEFESFGEHMYMMLGDKYSVK